MPMDQVTAIQDKSGINRVRQILHAHNALAVDGDALVRLLQIVSDALSTPITMCPKLLASSHAAIASNAVVHRLGVEPN